MSAYEGLRVVDLSTGIAGPLAAAFFADFGADVIKIESPEGDAERRGVAFVTWNRGKRGAVADAAITQDRAHVGTLIRQADLVIVRQASELAAWGVDASAPAGPVVLELPVWQGEAPWFGGRESQALLAARSGYSRRQSSYSGGPVDIVYPHILYIQAVMGATAATAALIERLRSGAGQVVTVDGMHAVAECFTGNYTLDPELPIPDSSVGPGGSNPTYSHYQGADGKWFLVAGLTPKFQERILRAISEEWIIDDPRINGDLAAVYSEENRSWVFAALRNRMATRPRAEWLDLFRKAGVPSASLNTPSEAFASEQTRMIGMRREVLDEQRGRITIPGQPITAHGTPAVLSAGAPGLGDPVCDLEWRPRAEREQGWRGATGGKTSEGPLAGLRVLLLGTFVAGPYGAFLLGHLGADVIKIEAPGGDPWRTRGFYYSDGMRSIVIDLKRPEGRDVYLRLAAEADLVIDNMRPGVPESLGVGYDDVVKINPDIVTASLTGFGQEGPLAQEPGFDPVLQAWSGMCVAQGGDDTPVLYTVPVCDVSGAALLAFGSVVALFHRLRTGEGQKVTTSLAAAGIFMQSGQLTEGAEPAVGGRDFAGPGEMDRYYRVSDGWIRIQALTGTTLADVLRALDSGEDDVEKALSTLTAEEALARLFAGGIPAAEARLARDVVLSGEHEGRFRFHRPDPAFGYFRPQRYAEFSRTSYDQDMYPPGAGEHSLDVLVEVGFSAADAEALQSSGAVVQGGPMVAQVLNPYR